MTVVRLNLLQMPETRLIVRAPQERDRPVPIPEAYAAVRSRDPRQAHELFLSEAADHEGRASVTFRPSTCFQFKQMLWHSGLLVM